MKIQDDYTSKHTLWARRPTVVPLPRFDGIPEFEPRKFSTYEAYNEWKKDLLEEIARRGGVRWKR